MRNTVLLAIVMALTLPTGLVHGQEEEEQKKEKKFQLNVHINSQLALSDFVEKTSFERFLEVGSTSRAYSSGETALSFDISGIFALKKQFGFVWSFEILVAEYDGEFDVSTPHPLLFNKHRTDRMEVEGLEYSEFSTHSALPISSLCLILS